MLYQQVIVQATELHQWSRQHCGPDDRPDHPDLETPWAPLRHSGHCALACHPGLGVRMHRQYQGIHEGHHDRERRAHLEHQLRHHDLGQEGGNEREGKGHTQNKANEPSCPGSPRGPGTGLNLSKASCNRASFFFNR